VHKERENCEAGVLLGSFWYGAIFRTQFALLLFLRGLMSSILSFCYRTKFCCKETFVEKMQSWYLLCSSDFFVGEPFGVRRCLLKNHPLAFIDCCCFQTFVERENFFEKYLLFFC
jgi:hypothetical protein